MRTFYEMAREEEVIQNTFYRKIDGTVTKKEVVWENFYGKIPTGRKIGFISGDTKNNHISNLRLEKL